MQKKGISAVVATILIVLLSVAAIGIVWAVLKPAIQKSAARVETKCIDVDLSIDNADCSSGTLKVTLNKGEIKAIKVVFYDSSGESLGDVQTLTNVPEELGTRVYNASDLNFPSEASSLNIAAIVESETGEEINCGLVYPQPVAC